MGRVGLPTLRIFLGFCLFIACNLSPYHTLADAWLQPVGKGIVVSGVSVYRTDIFYDRDGKRLDVPSFSKTEMRVYGEYGVSDAWTVGASDALMLLTQDDRAGSRYENSGEAGLELFARRKLWQHDAMVLSVQPSLRMPAHHQELSARAPVGAPDEWQSSVEIQSGYGFDAFNLHHYVTLGLGMRARYSQAHDQWTAKLAGGFTLHPDWELRPEVSVVRSLHMDTDAQTSVAGTNDYMLLKVQSQLAYHWSQDVSLVAGAFLHAMARNTGDNGGFLLSVEKRF
jgi:hypothetical protein